MIASDYEREYIASTIKKYFEKKFKKVFSSRLTPAVYITISAKFWEK